MTYARRLSEAKEKVFYKSIATKILDALIKIRSSNAGSMSAHRRWVWELIQNAKDVHSTGGVRIEIDFEPDVIEPHVTFRHNGSPFTVDNLRFLIEQTSSKDRSEDEGEKRSQSGKYGTGFLTTHLLSEVVTVTGVVKDPEEDQKRFELVLDRSGRDIAAITAAVRMAEGAIEGLDDLPAHEEYQEGDFSTAFRYGLETESLEVARAGIADLYKCLPYTLVFVDEVNSVTVRPGRRFFRNPVLQEALSPAIHLESVIVEDGAQSLAFSVVRLAKGLTSIATPVSVNGGKVTLLPIEEETPRLFCDFPLIGAEMFPFPTLVNNPNFNPTEPRDGVWLTTTSKGQDLSATNKAFIQDAVELYSMLLKHATTHEWGNLHLLAQMPEEKFSSEWVDSKWLATSVIGPLRKQLLEAPIVTTASGKLAPMQDHSGGTRIWFPHSESPKVRQELWQCAVALYPDALPRQSDIEIWHTVSWLGGQKLTVRNLAAIVEKFGTVSKLVDALGARRDWVDWLNAFYKLLAMEPGNYDEVIMNRAIFPNQRGDFCKRSQLHWDAGNIGDEFKDILALLGRDVRAKLADERLRENFDATEVFDRGHIVKQLTSEIATRHSASSNSGRLLAFKKMLLYFADYPDQARALFPDLVRNKHHLYDDDEIVENINKADQLAGLLTEFKVASADELRKLISGDTSSGKGLLPVTQEILLSLGITSPEAWAQALENNPDLAAQFSHESTPSLDKFVFVQTLIANAKRAVIEHLKTLPEYDLSQMETTASTVLAGIRKRGESVYVVVRPALDGQVIIYYSSELDVLDYERSELWASEGTLARPISLGRVLRQGQIKKFPI